MICLIEFIGERIADIRRNPYQENSLYSGGHPPPLFRACSPKSRWHRKLLPPPQSSYDIGCHVNHLPTRITLPALVLTLGLAGSTAFGAWQDETAGRPMVEILSTKDLGNANYKWITLQDHLGRLFVGGNELQVFDGQSWQSFPVPKTYALRALAFGETGRLWAGAINEIGYFEEMTLGKFQFHSLISLLPEGERVVGDIWACVPAGRYVYYFSRNKVLRWDGDAFRIWSYASESRLFPLNFEGELWYHHLETGLYRVTETGPRLEVPAARLPNSAILGLVRDAQGLVCFCANGIVRPGLPPVRISDEALSKYITDSRPTSFAALPGGNHALGTINGGLALFDPAGGLLRILDPVDGLPSRAIFSITPEAGDYLWSATPDGIFRLEAGGHATLFGPANGLKGQTVIDLQPGDRHFYALTRDGVFTLMPSTDRGARFEPVPQLTELYNSLLPFRGGLLLARHGGMDFFDGTGVRPLFTILAKAVFFIVPSRASPGVFYLAESPGLGRLQANEDGSFTHAPLLELPDSCTHLHEDARGRLWIGTASKGAFTYDPRTQALAPINDPATGRPFAGGVAVAGGDRQILFFHEGRVLRADPDGAGLRVLEGPPLLDFIALQSIPGGRSDLVAFKRTNASGTSAQGLGVLTVDGSGTTQWQELEAPALGAIGFIRTMVFTTEAGRPVLWLGGSEGLLRLDYDTIPVMKNPDSPLIRLDPGHSSPASAPGGLAFPFQDHHLSFRVFTDDYSRGKEWLFQSRLGGGAGEWSAASQRRLYEFTNLSEGSYRFEVRTVNGAGRASEPAVFAFRILPPWYRSSGALAGYVAGLGLAIFAFIRFRERRIRQRNQELETQVRIRTEELVKASAAKDEFLAGVSHEIRNPMNGVIGIAETMRTDALDPESRRKFGLLRQCATHLSSLLEDILDFSRVQAGAVELESRAFDLPELVQSVAAMTAADSEKRGIPVEIAISPAVPTRLTGDPRRIRQILLNFVSNALKFSGRGQISVTVWCKAAGPRHTEVIFAVSDEGPGISAEEQKRLFTRFERGAAAQQGRVPGTGLGLALCKGLAEKMGGRIWLESQPGEGSCFYFSAPLESVAEDAGPAPAADPAPRGRDQLALVVDDEEYNRIVLADLLEQLGFTVLTAAEGEAALALAAGRNCDVVFLDYDLPGLSGLDVARGIRALPDGSARALILATTAFTTPEKRAQCVAAGMNAFLGKPVTMERLRQALATATGPDAAPPPARPAPPPDGLANLRLIASRKGTAFADELALYLSEFGVELDQLQVALRQEDAANAGHYAHLLYGRCAFIAERELEQLLRRIEEVSANGQWDEARALGAAVAAGLDRLRVRLACAAPVVPPGSAR